MTEGQPFFHPYDLLLLGAGLALLVSVLGRALLEHANLTTSLIYLTVGLLAGPLLLDLAPQDPLIAIPILERISELGVIMSLIVVGIRIGRPLTWAGWRSTARLILLVMPATIFAIAASGYWLFGLALGPALLLGAILAPTDPILAGPLEEQSLEDEAEERFGLSSEAGFNDGFAFPFVYLGLYSTWRLAQWETWIGYWIIMDLLYAVMVALPLGWILGYLVGRWYLAAARRGAATRKRTSFVPLALLLSVYGLTESIGAYGFLAAFTTGLGFRRALDWESEQLTRFANFTEAVDDLTRAVVLIMVGTLLRWEDFSTIGWPLLVFAGLLILVLRPGITFLATAGGGFRTLNRIYWGWFGIRGIGSIYYLSYAIGRGVDEAAARSLFAIVMATILTSIVVHGFSVRPFLKRYEGEREVEV